MTLALTAGAVCLALNVYFEARSESQMAQFAVAEITLNRVASPSFPDTICEVVWQPKQFSWTHDGKSDKPHNPEAWANAKWVATTILDYSMGIQIVGPEALYYHATYVNPYWSQGFTEVAQVGAHVFYKVPSK